MSLLHRTGSNENVGNRRISYALDTDGTGHSQDQSGRKTNLHVSREDGGRRLSFNPVGEWVPDAAKEAPIGAFEVPKSKRIVQVIAAAIYCLFAAGIVFGYAALKPVLIREGVYRDRCTKRELENNVEVCYDQELGLNFMFTVAAVSTNVAALPIGTILDRFGPRVCGLLGGFFVTTGCLFMAFAWNMKPLDGYIPGYFFLALGGPFVYISSFQLSNTFPRYSGLILALLTGAFDTSSAIFLFYRLIYAASNGTFFPKKFFLAYLVVPIFIFTVQTFLMPAVSYKTVGELVKQAENEDLDEHDSDDGAAEDIEQIREERRIRRESVISEITELIGSKNADEQIKREEATRAKSGVYGALHGKTALQQICSWWFVLITLFTVVQMCRINYFVATIRSQYTYLLDSYEKATEVNEFFDVALPLGGVVAIPFIGLVLDNLSTTFVLSMLVTTATTIGILGVLPYTWAAYANVVLFVLYRPFYYTAVSDYSAKVFGFTTFGKVYGLLVCLAGLFNFSQAGFDNLTHGPFKNNPIPVNVLLLSVAVVVGIALVSYVWIRSYNIERERLEEEAEGAHETLIPGADQRAEEDHHPIDVHGYGTNE